MNTRTLTAKDFRDPLLNVLGSLTGYQTGKSVMHNKVYEPLFKNMNVDIEDFDVTEQEVPWPERWTQFAFQALCKQELGAREGRGSWMLTPKGVKAALEIAAPGTVQVITKTPPEGVVVAPVVSKEVLVVPEEVVITEPVETSPYHPDPYIRERAVQKTACFGTYTDQSTTCEDCPVQEICCHAKAASLSRMAANLKALDRQPKKVATKKVDQNLSEVFSGDISRVDVKGNFAWLKQAEINVINARAPANCNACGNIISKGTQAVWARLSGATGGKGAAMFHPSCFDTLRDQNK